MQKNHGAEMVIITAKIEEELAELGKEEAEEYLKRTGYRRQWHQQNDKICL